MHIYLDGIAIAGFQGIGSRQIISGMSEMNFFIGANNSGKSIALTAIHRTLPRMIGGKKTDNKLEQTDRHFGSSYEDGHSIRIGKSSEKLKVAIKDAIERTPQKYTYNKEEIENSIDIIIDNLTIDGCVWFQIGDITRVHYNPRPGFVISDLPNELKITGWLKSNVWHLLYVLLSEYTGGSINAHVKEVMQCIADLSSIDMPETYLIPAKRKLGIKDEPLSDLSGTGLIDHLAKLQNPDFDQRNLRNKFNQINDFVKYVTDKQDAVLEVPSERNHLLVHMDGKVLPLSSLGTGIHEVILIAAFCTIYTNSIMCIEEPEVHLHPILQRKLINYLREKTQNQYFIATHSAALINTKGSTVFHVSNDGASTEISRVLDYRGGRSIIEDLGIAASDLLQANCIIWVEGPSDRIYINHWIKFYDNGLVEGVDYSIMFYGGGLISHLSADPDALNDFISLNRLNANVGFVLDSDKSSKTDNLKSAAERISQEIIGNGGHIWITEGREIENYVNPEKLQLALSRLHPRIYDEACETGMFDNSFHFFRASEDGKKRERYTKGDKVGAAKLICSEAADFDILNLSDEIERLVSFIRNSSSA